MLHLSTCPVALVPDCLVGFHLLDCDAVDAFNAGTGREVEDRAVHSVLGRSVLRPPLQTLVAGEACGPCTSIEASFGARRIVSLCIKDVAAGMEVEVEESLLNEHLFSDWWDCDEKPPLGGCKEGGTVEKGTLPTTALTKDIESGSSVVSIEDNNFAVGNTPLARDSDDSCQSSVSSE